MTKIRTYECPGTARHAPHQFRYTHHPSVAADPVPRFCAVCGFDSQAEDFGDAVTAPHIRQPIGAIVDNNYRDMEAGSEHRAQVAMEVHGLDASEANLMKMTDMKDNAKAGENSVVEVHNAVSQTMAQINTMRPGSVGFQGNGLGYSESVSQGAFPNAGARAMASVRKKHSEVFGQSLSDRPALETTAPNYRRRV